MDVAVSLGPCDELGAQVYVRAVSPQAPGEGAPDAPRDRSRLEGTLEGPRCRHATTLPTSVRIVDLGGGGAPGVLVGRAVLTEPSFWTPQVPSLYRLDARLVGATGDVAHCTRLVGLRRLGVRGRSFWLDGHRWVPRGVGVNASRTDGTGLRDTAATAFVDCPDDGFLDWTDGEGVAVIVRLPDEPPGGNDTLGATTHLVRLARHPSVTIAVVPGGWPTQTVQAFATATRQVRGTLLLARPVDGATPPPSRAGCDALIVELAADALPHDSWHVDPGVPLIACRSGPDADAAERRAACDRLQADLAAWGVALAAGTPRWDWAGYVCDGPVRDALRASRPCAP